MNLYMLVEGRRTEMAAYPAFFSHELPFMTQVERPYEANQNNYYMVSGFGYPNMFHHIENCVKEMNRYKRFDHLVICLDSDEESVKGRITEVERIFATQNLWPNNAHIRVIVQKKCIESWFLGGVRDMDLPSNEKLNYFLKSYNVFKRDPERMNKPEDFRGSVGDFHCSYLTYLMEREGKYYTKRRPDAVCTKEFYERMKKRAQSGKQLGTFNNFLNFCKGLYIK